MRTRLLTVCSRARLGLFLAVFVVVAVIGDGRGLGPSLTGPLAIARTASSFHGVLFYRDSSGWGQAVRLAVAQWNAANVGVTFKPATATGCGEVCIVSSPDAIDAAAAQRRPNPRGSRLKSASSPANA